MFFEKSEKILEEKLDGTPVVENSNKSGSISGNTNQVKIKIQESQKSDVPIVFENKTQNDFFVNIYRWNDKGNFKKEHQEQKSFLQI